MEWDGMAWHSYLQDCLSQWFQSILSENCSSSSFWSKCHLLGPSRCRISVTAVAPLDQSSPWYLEGSNSKHWPQDCEDPVLSSRIRTRILIELNMPVGLWVFLRCLGCSMLIILISLNCILYCFIFLLLYFFTYCLFISQVVKEHLLLFWSWRTFEHLKKETHRNCLFWVQFLKNQAFL